MVDFQHLPRLETIKAQAKHLRDQFDREGHIISHSKSLEALSRQYGFKDWNVFSAALQRQPQHSTRAYHVGTEVMGLYLGIPFKAQIQSVTNMPDGFTRLALELHTAIDVVKFDSFSAFRKRIRCVVNKNGKSPQKTSDGQPQICILTK